MGLGRRYYPEAVDKSRGYYLPDIRLRLASNREATGQYSMPYSGTCTRDVRVGFRATTRDGRGSLGEEVE